MCCKNILRQTINVELKTSACVYSFFVVNSDTHKYKNKSVNEEAQFVSMGIPKIVGKPQNLKDVYQWFKNLLNVNYRVLVCVCNHNGL